MAAKTAKSRTPRRRWLRRIAWCVVLFTIVLNALAFMQAWSMTHYAPSGKRTKPPEKLTTTEKAKLLCTGPTVPRPVNRLNPADYGLAVETLRFPGHRGIALEAWRTRVPGATAVLMFPGYGSSRDTLLRAAQEFTGLGCEVWMMDFHGTGGSGGDTTTIGWHEADDVAAAFEKARAESPTRRIVLYGQSLGAAAVMRATATSRATPGAVVVEAPFGSLLDTVGNRFTAMGVPRFPFAQLLTFWGGVQHGFNGFDHSPIEYARTLRGPVLVMMGERDTRVGLDAGREIAAALGDRGQFHVFTGKRHAFLVQDATAEWRRVVGGFLNRPRQ